MKGLQFSISGRSCATLEQNIAQTMLANSSILDRAKRGEPEYKDSLGWLDVNEWAGQPWLGWCQTLAREVQSHADVLVVVGIGGSNQAARAVVDAIGEKTAASILSGPEITFRRTVSRRY